MHFKPLECDVDSLVSEELLITAIETTINQKQKAKSIGGLFHLWRLFKPFEKFTRTS